MKKKSYVIIFLIVLFVILFANNFIGYNGSINQATLLCDFSGYNNKAKIIIDVEFIADNKPICFYLTEQLNLCLATYKHKKVLNNDYWRVSTVSNSNEKFDKYSNYLIPVYNNMFFKSKDEELNNVFYGVVAKSDESKIKQFNFTPQTKEFNYENNDYVLWYYIGNKNIVNELNLKRGIDVERKVID